MKKIFCAALFFISHLAMGQTNADTLQGVVDHNLININRLDGGVGNVVPVTNIPSSVIISGFSWCEPNSCYYAVISDNTNRVLARISESGNYALLGQLSVGGQSLNLIEGIGYNRFDGELYVSASLNGDVSTNDFFSESLVRVDTTSLTGVLLGVFAHSSNNEPEADMLTFDDNGVLYYSDGLPNSSLTIYQQDIAFNFAPITLYSSSYIPASGLTVKDDVLYYSNQAELLQIDLATTVHSVVNSMMYPPGGFNGNHRTCLTWKAEDVNQMPDPVNFSDQDLCQNDELVLNVFQAGAAYLWNDGSTNATLTVNQEGTYWVQVSNAFGTVADTIAITEIDCSCDDARVYIPNVFTPNNDGVNDLFTITELCGAKLVELKIYNRWGQLLFITEQPGKGWDGRNSAGEVVPEGSYYYSVIFEKNSEGGAVEESFSGVFTLLR